MSGLEVNKIIAAIIMAILIMILISSAGDLIVKKQGKNNLGEVTAYKIDLPESDISVSAESKKFEVTESISVYLVGASPDNGEKLFKKCSSCHNYNEGGAKKVGPNLWNIINRPKASINGFAYSKALVQLGGTWTFEELSEFLYKPKQFVEGTKMNFAGLKKAKDRADLILFLKNQSNNPVPLP